MFQVLKISVYHLFLLIYIKNRQFLFSRDCEKPLWSMKISWYQMNRKYSFCIQAETDSMVISYTQ